LLTVTSQVRPRVNAICVAAESGSDGTSVARGVLSRGVPYGDAGFRGARGSAAAPHVVEHSLTNDPCSPAA